MRVVIEVQIGSAQDVCFTRDAAGFLPESGGIYIVQVWESHPEEEICVSLSSNK